MTPTVRQRETLGRFLRDRDFSRVKMRAKRQAFGPQLRSEESRLETSVFRISKRTFAEIKQIAVDEVEPFRGTQSAVAVLVVSEVTALSLDVWPDVPPLRHAVIVGWSANVEDQMNATLDLVNKARIELLS